MGIVATIPKAAIAFLKEELAGDLASRVDVRIVLDAACSIGDRTTSGGNLKESRGLNSDKLVRNSFHNVI